MLGLLLATLCFIESPAASAAGQDLIGIDFILGETYRVDAKTAAVTVVGNTGLSQDLWHSMAKDSQGRIYAGYGNDSNLFAIYEINLQDGHATFVTQTPFGGLIGLAFDDHDILFATVDQTPTLAGGPCDLYTIDLVTGISQRIGTTGFTGIGGLTFCEGVLWGWDEYEGLLKVDRLTGIATDVNPRIEDPGGSGGSAVSTLSASDDGVLYAGLYSLFVVDKITGALAFIDFMNPGLPFLAGMEFLPAQPAPFSLGVMGETGGPMGAFVAGATPGGQVAFLATSGGGGPVRVPSGHACAGVTIDLNSRLRLIGLVAADAAGKALLGPVQVPAYPAGTLRLQALDLQICATSNRARVID